MSDELSDADKALLEGIASRREGTELRFYEPARLLSKEALEAIDLCAESVKTHVTKPAYYRLLAADILPPNVHRALYLDADIVCTGSLEGLFALDLKGRPVAMNHGGYNISACNRLGYPPSEGYSCSGVILFDLDLWRKEGLGPATISWRAANAKKCTLHDQDAINGFLHGRILPFDFAYHITQGSFYVFYWILEEKNNYYASQTQFLPKSEWPALLAAVEAPRLVHTPGQVKMWHRESDNPFTPVWRYFYAQSPWATEPLKWKYPPAARAKTKIKRLGRMSLERLNLIAQATFPCPQEAYKVAQRVLDELSFQPSAFSGSALGQSK